MGRVLVVDDDPDMLLLLRRVIEKKCGGPVRTANSGEAAWQLLETWLPDVIVTDIKMPGMDGLTLLRQAKELAPNLAIILMTGYGTVDLAVQALKEGAYDFFEKPFDNDHLVHAVQRSLERLALLRENHRLQKQIGEASRFQGLIGRAPRLRDATDLIDRIADTDVTVLIRGESGTGKELAAQALHALSSRAGREMITVNCPALPEQILESELFGYARGAFTGAVKDKPGLFLEADGSTILLDEIGDLPLSLQTKLLRVLQEKEIRPLGQTATRKVDVRVLSSTNQNLEEKIRQGLFREDLFYRLNVVTVTMPPLRDIPEDIPLLAHHFLKRFGREYDRQELTLAPEAVSALVRRNWPGNTRELQNVIKRAVLLASGSDVTPADLGQPASGNDACPDRDNLLRLPFNEAKRQLTERFTVDYLTHALKLHHGNVSIAARACGLGRQTLQRLLRNLGIEAHRYRSGGD